MELQILRWSCIASVESGRLDGRIAEGVVGGGRKAGREENARPDRCQEDRVVVQKADWKRRE